MNALAAPISTPASGSFRQYTIQRGDGIDRLACHGVPRRPLRDHEVRVRIHAVALNHRDLMVARGTAGAPGRPVVPASDAAGEVIETGPGVAALRPGDRVISTFFPDWIAGPVTDETAARALGGTMDGVLAEEVVLPAEAWVRMPANLDYVEAATLTCAGVTAWHGLFGLEPIPPGGTVALLGTGGVSIWALQLAKAAGLRAIVTSSDEAKLERARALGADATVNYLTRPQWGAALRELTDGRGVDRVLDIGGPDTVGQSLAALRTGGTVAVIGRLTGSTPAQFDPAALFGGAKRLQGLMVGSRAMTDELARFVERTRLRPVIDRVFGFDEARAAYAYLGAAAHFGKVVIARELAARSNRPRRQRFDAGAAHGNCTPKVATNHGEPMNEQASRYFDYIAWDGRAPRATAAARAPEPAIDTTYIRLATERELRYWTSELAVTIYTLRDAIAATGSRCAKVVRAYLEEGGTR